MPKRTTIVTAIPYVNSVPHIGNVLTTLSGDVTARYLRMRGNDVYFVAGADENGLKIKEAAEAAHRNVDEFVDEISGRYEDIFGELNIRYDEFVRTSKERHRFVSQSFFEKLKENGYIYLGKYEGWYDVSTETFFKEADLVDGKSPDGNPVRWVSEDTYYFKLSAFSERLLDHIRNNPDFIIPNTRRNEVLAFIHQGLRDTAISRQNPGWGIPVPNDENQVIYVWFDALINYVTATGWPDPGWADLWPPVVQWLGKDILTRFHATLWPAMLMGVGLPLPEHVVAHGWILFGGEKLSKSKGTAVRPLDLAQALAEKSGCAPEIAIDVVRHYITSTVALETDSVFTHEDFDRRYNVDLANDLGNALNRSLAMTLKFTGGKVPVEQPEAAAVEAILNARRGYEESMETFRLSNASEAAFGLVRFLNKYIDTRAPWALAKSGDPALSGVIRSMLLCLRAAEGLVRPAMPATADEISTQLNLTPLANWADIGDPASIPGGAAVNDPRPIFPRLDLTKKPIASSSSPTTAPQPVEQKTMEETQSPPDDQIGIEDFVKVKLRIARVLEAEPVEGADKLMKLQVVIGQEKRQIVAGIRKSYAPEDLIGRQIVVCVNLKPAKLRGIESQGMLLAATDDDGAAILLQPDRETPEGAGVK